MAASFSFGRSSVNVPGAVLAHRAAVSGAGLCSTAHLAGSRVSGLLEPSLQGPDPRGPAVIHSNNTQPPGGQSPEPFHAKLELSIAMTC